MTVHSFGDAQVDKARHALGLTRARVAYRNYYSSGDDADWDDLVARGMAVKRKSPVSQDFLYHLTRQAAYYFLNEGESIGLTVRFPPAPLLELANSNPPKEG